MQPYGVVNLHVGVFRRRSSTRTGFYPNQFTSVSRSPPVGSHSYPLVRYDGPNALFLPVFFFKGIHTSTLVREFHSNTADAVIWQAIFLRNAYRFVAQDRQTKTSQTTLPLISPALHTILPPLTEQVQQTEHGANPWRSRRCNREQDNA